MKAQNLWENVVWGTRLGAIVSGVFVVLYTLQWLAGGGGSRLPYLQTVEVYAIGGLGGGLLTGLLRPFTRTIAGAAIVGVLAALPFVVVYVALQRPPSMWGETDYLTIALASVLGGGLTGAWTRSLR